MAAEAVKHSHPPTSAYDEGAADGTEGASRFALWFGLLGGGVAWTAHLLLAYAISEFGCVAGWGERSFLGASAVAWALILVSAASAALAVVATVVARRSGANLPRPHFDPARDAADEGPPRSSGYMARAGVITSGLFAFVIVVQSIPIFFFLGSC